MGLLRKKSKILLEKDFTFTRSSFHSISSKILLFLQSDPFFTPYGVIIFYSVRKIVYFMSLQINN